MAVIVPALELSDDGTHFAYGAKVECAFGSATHLFDKETGANLIG